MSLVKTGYPFLLLDAAVTNVNLLEAQRQDLTTMVRISLPQADPEQRKIIFDSLNEQARETNISFKERQFDTAPDFYGLTWMAESKGVQLDMIRQLRDYAWSSYKLVTEKTKEKTPFDYRPLQEHMIFNTVRLEERLFRGVGLSVPVESYAALLSVLVSGV
jgi:hypothetical protein